MRSFSQRLTALEAVMERKRDPVYTITLTTGETVTCTFEQAWAYFKDGKGHTVETVAVDRDDYSENAALLQLLCMP